MRLASIRFGALAGLISCLPVMALLYLGQQLAGWNFVPFDIFDLMARLLPGDVITLGIDIIVDTISALGLADTDSAAKLIEQLMALLLFAIAGGLFGAIITWFVNRRMTDQANSGKASSGGEVAVGAVAGLVFLLIVVVVEFGLDSSALSLGGILWLAAVFVGWGALLGRIVAPQDEQQPAQEAQEERRQVLLKLLGGSAGVAIAATGLGRILDGSDEAVGAGQPLATATATPPSPTPLATESTQPQAVATPTQQLTAEATARERISPAPGTRPELTANEEFYRIDINTRSRVLKEDEWLLQVDGLFDKPRDLTLADIMAFPAITQPITMSCISNRIGGDLIGTSNWTGARLRDVIEELGISADARALVLEGDDGFHETVVMQDMLDPRTLLVYGMNGETLPVDHGFPLRIYIPNRYGMKQPKWIVRITAVPEEEDGYWVKRGWSREARPQVISVIDSVATDRPTAEGQIPIGGIAWAGDRGIQKVELQIGDEPWVEADLRTPPLSPLTWVQWRYDWPAAPGKYQIRVRATDGMGALQIEEESGVRPDGATGFDETTATIA